MNQAMSPGNPAYAAMAAPAPGGGPPDPWAAPYVPRPPRARRGRSTRLPSPVGPGAPAARRDAPERPGAPSRRGAAGLPGNAGRGRRAARGALLGGLGLVGLALLLTIALPVPFGCRSLVVMSGSMEPAIPTGSLIVVKRVPGRAIAVGDVVSFRSPEGSGRILTHRVQAVRDEGGQIAVETRGDANTGTESWAIDPRGTVGRVAFHVPLLGYLVAPLQGVVPRLLLVVVPALLLGGMLLLDIWRPQARGRGGPAAPVPAAAAGGGR